MDIKEIQIHNKSKGKNIFIVTICKLYNILLFYETGKREDWKCIKL